jgi:endonuclease/exonuclease/phosphatase family metal-dependent hydrolase
MTGKIPLLSRAEIAALHAQVATRSLELARELTWLSAIDAQQPDPAPPPAELTVVVFNAERGARFDGIRTLLMGHAALRQADVVLLNEADWGMARSANRHVTRDLALVLGLGYVYGIEFLELTKGEAAELEAAGENTWSLHGNAILSRWPLRNARVRRLPLRCSWAAGSQARVGCRMALLAEIETASGPLTLACTHLENRTTPEGRRDQMRALLECLPAGQRAVVGGDLNTSTIDSGHDDQVLSVPAYLREDPRRLRHPEPYEPLFADVRAAGFLVDEVNVPEAPTSVPFGIMDRAYWLKLDWIFARGMTLSGALHPPQVVAAELDGARVSDHDFVVAGLAV